MILSRATHECVQIAVPCLSMINALPTAKTKRFHPLLKAIFLMLETARAPQK